MKVFAIMLALMLVFLPANVSARIEAGEFEIQGWCITGPDPRADGTAEHHAFDHAVTGLVNAEANKNDPPHVHVDDLINDGWIKSKEELYGRSFIFSGYWVEEEGQNHFRAYVPKDDNALEEVSCEKALQVTADQKDGYLDGGVGDLEMQRQHGLGSDGQTTTEQGRPRGKE